MAVDDVGGPAAPAKPQTGAQVEGLVALYAAVADALHRTSERVFAVTLSLIGFNVVATGAVLIQRLELLVLGKVMATMVLCVINVVGLHYLNGRADAFGRRENELYAIRDRLLANEAALSGRFVDDRGARPKRWWFVAAICTAWVTSLLAIWAPVARLSVA